MVIGCCGNYYGYPMVGWQRYGGYYNYNYTPYSSSPCLGRRILGETTALIQTGYPWVYSSSYGGIGCLDPNTSYQDAVNIQMLMHNPNYTPYINVRGVGNNNNAAEQARMNQMARNSADRDFLVILYNNLGQNIQNLISYADRYLQSSNLDDTQRQAIEALKAEAQALEQKRQEFAQRSSNMEVGAATEEVNNMQREYNALSARAREIGATLSSNGSNGNNGANGANGANGNNGADGANGNNGADGANGNNGADGANGNPTYASINQQYNSTLKPAIEGILAQNRLDNIFPGKREEITQKQQELEQAMIDQKPLEEVQNLYNELNAMVTEVQNKFNELDQQWAQEVIQTSNQMITDTQKFLTDYDDFISANEKQELRTKMDDLKNAIAQNQSTDEIWRIYSLLHRAYIGTNSSVTYNYNRASNIASSISIGVAGADLSSEKEDMIKTAVNKIDKDNIRSVLVLWDRYYKANTGDSCLLESLYGEFSSSPDTKQSLTNTILTAVCDFARQKGIYNEVYPHVVNILGRYPLNYNTSYSSIYSEFNMIVQLLKNAGA